MTFNKRGRGARNDAEWARDIQHRLERLEAATNVRVGGWVLNEQDGQLIATAKGQRILLSDALLSDNPLNPPTLSPARQKMLLPMLAELTNNLGIDLQTPSGFIKTLKKALGLL